MSKKVKLRVLVTYGWNRTSYVVAESLSKAGYEVYICDPSAWSMGRFSRYTQGFDFVSPPFKQPKHYIRDIVRIVNKRRIDILLPVHEDSMVIAKYREKLPRNLLVICPPYEKILEAIDKNLIIDFADKAAVNAPKKIAPSCLEEAYQLSSKLEFPVVIKTRRGNSGKGVFFANSTGEVKKIYPEVVRKFSLTDDNLPILQEYITGDLYGSCFLAQNGAIKACFLEKYLRWKESKFGTSVIREPCEWGLLRDYTERMVNMLEWTGVGHFDFVAPKDRSRAYLLEMNPRFWGALNLAIFNGYDFPLGLVSMYETGRPDPNAFIPSVRKYKSLWIVGEMIALLEEMRQKKWSAPYNSFKRIFFSGEKTSYDDFRFRDPLPLFAEMIYYGSHFFRFGCKINPIEEEMMR